MILSMIGIGLASIVLWLLRLYVLGGRARLGGRPLDPTDKLFPPLSKEVEEELDRRRKALAEVRHKEKMFYKASLMLCFSRNGKPNRKLWILRDHRRISLRKQRNTSLNERWKRKKGKGRQQLVKALQLPRNVSRLRL